jgi:hypothetical protein
MQFSEKILSLSAEAERELAPIFSEIDAISGLRAAVCIAECDEKPAVAIVSALDLLR